MGIKRIAKIVGLIAAIAAAVAGALNAFGESDNGVSVPASVDAGR